jgi:hypothetical protein
MSFTTTSSTATDSTGSAVRRGLWEFSTDLTKENVGGIGIKLLFRFQVAVIVWAFGVALCWTLVAFSVDTELFSLGTRASDTPRMRCILVQQGYDKQHRLMWVKTLFIAFVYVGTFILSLVFATLQLREFRKHSDATWTMGDYVVLVSGLPIKGADPTAEQELIKIIKFAMDSAADEEPTEDGKSAIQELTKQIVGVSICWDFGDSYDDVMVAITEDLEQRRTHMIKNFGTSQGLVEDSAEPTEEGSSKGHLLRRFLFWPVEEKLIDKSRTILFSPLEKKEASDIVALLNSLETSGSAFIVFNTMKARNDAVKQLDNKLQVGGKPIKIETKKTMEPQTVIWENFTQSHKHTKLQNASRALKGLGCVLLVLFIFNVVCFFPIAKWTLDFSYAHGVEADFFGNGLLWRSIILTLLETLGGALLAITSQFVAGMQQCRFVDTQESIGIILYFVTVLINTGLDIWLGYQEIYRQLIQNDAHMHDGTLVKDVKSVYAIFESYAMQKDLGKYLSGSLQNFELGFAFPSYFLTPFLFEPLILMIIPLFVGGFLVRSHREIYGAHADNLLASLPMDLCRYGDIIVNMGLAVLIFFFPSGNTLEMFVLLGICHIYIYRWDHYRTLRHVPRCVYADFSVERTADLLLSAPCGLILSCMVYKSNCHSDVHCTNSNMIFVYCALALCCHVVVHCALVLTVVPRLAMLGLPENNYSVHQDYTKTAKGRAASFFNKNPVHCLRSKYIHKHNPPCWYCTQGKEHLLELNEDINCHYSQHGSSSVEPYYCTLGLAHSMTSLTETVQIVG